MYFWNPKALAGELAAGRVGDAQKCGYLLATFALSWVWDWMAVLREGGRSAFWWQQGFSALLVLVYVAGTWVAFKIYRKGTGRDFIAAYICLGVPSAVRSVVIGVGVLCTLIVAVVLGTEPYSQAYNLLYDSAGYALAALIHGLYFHSMWTAIQVASAPAEAQAAPP